MCTKQLENKIIYFNFAKRLFNGYNILQIPNELYNNLIDLSVEYNLEIPSYQNIRETYNYLINKYYHNEITIKSNFINNILLNLKENITIFEFKLENSRADLCTIGKRSIAFEIKTDLDNFLRLEKQINDYSEVFEEVYIICSKQNLKNISKILPSHCGIYSYNISDNGIYTFRKERKSSIIKNLNKFKQLNLLSKTELKNSFSKCKNLSSKEQMIELILNNYTLKYINYKFKKVVKEKYKEKWEFLKQNNNQIYEIDYQWFFKNNISPQLIYQ
ncbi:sce7726 family protein [Clostridium perfringens]|uniref:sce7726 family protein n=1 Tax=Clostridium perfringens TaxID=1502 RepID=UPI000DF10847|nr:sce7726 family protein [Clostridium perfringens]EGT4143777.1 hypothetical protein [Clostridium perfringens]MCX0397442.1 sce7726 family protein [Clostridium perfringens]MDM0624941.1 sce7726 family protein [Clostridium perfringens]STB41889.1 Uncharacterised protein [Clostridium perfringens]